MHLTKPTLDPLTGHRAGPYPDHPEALKRPAKLKKWAHDLTGILEGREAELFADWEFGPGSLTRTDFGRVLKKIKGCGSVVELRSPLDRETGVLGSPVVHAANYCGQHTVCPMCAGRVQDRRGMRFRAAIGQVAELHPYAYLLTATVPPDESWRDQLGALIRGWQSLRRMGQVRRRKRKDGTVTESRSNGEWGKVRAAIAKVELKRGSGSGLPHCHIHALVFSDEPIEYRVWSREEKAKPKSERIPLFSIPSTEDSRGWTPASKISSEWWKATGGVAKNIHVSPLRMREKDVAAGRSYSEAIIDMSREVLKYATKFDSKPGGGAMPLYAKDFIGIRDATYSRRLFMTYGEFREVPGNDFTGGGPHIREKPVIFEARWRGREYSPLFQRDKAVFPFSDLTDGKLARLTILNRAQGQVRRMRSAILKSKNHYRETRKLRPAFYARREYAEDGTWVEHLQSLEVPAAVAECPDDFSRWEAWLDQVMSQGAEFYSQVRENLRLMEVESLDGDLGERAREIELRRRAWKLSLAYDEWVTRLFLRTLERTKHAHAPP